MAKKLKDPNKPKKPLTAYFRFLKDHRARVKAENPDLKPPQLTKKCGELWREFDEEQKKKYQAEALAETTVWKGKMEEYKKTPGFAEFEKKRKEALEDAGKKKKKLPKDKNAPKKPQTAFFLYSGHVREEVKQSLPEENRRKVVLITKKIGAMWKALEESEKTSWKAKADKLKEKYKETLAEYKKSPEFAAYQDLLQEFKEQQKEREKQAKRKKKAAIKKARAPVVQKRQIESSSSESESASEDDRPANYVNRQPPPQQDVEMDSHEETEEESSEDEESS